MDIIANFVLLSLVVCIHGLCAVAICTPSQAGALGCDIILDPQTYGGGHPDLIQLGSTSSGEFDTSYAGLILCVPAGNYSALALYYVEGNDNGAGRVTIVNCGGAAIFDGRDSGAQGTGHWTTINILGSKYVHLRGDGDASVTYGLVARGSSSHGVHLDEGTSFVEVQNVETYANNYAGIVFRTYPRCGGRCGHVSSRASYGRLCARGRFVQRESVLHDNYVHDTPGEGFYVGTSHYFQDGNARAYDPGGSCAGETQPQPELKGVRIHGNIVHDTGMDGIQVGSAVEDVAVHHNEIKRWAHVQKYGDSNAIGMNPGTVGSVYNNHLEGRRRSLDDSEEYFGIVYYGRASPGGTPSRVYNNIVLHTNTAFMFLNKEDAPGQRYEFVYNTVYNFTGASPVKVYCLGTEAPMLLIDTGATVAVRNNIFALGPNEGIFSGLHGPHKRFYGNTNGVTGMDCLDYTDAYAHNLYGLDDAALVKFRGPLGGDFHLQSDSPARNAGVALPNGYFVGPDYDGVPRPADPAVTSQGAFEFVPAPPRTTSASPTSALTAAPITASPTVAPISAPWSATLVNVTVDFNTADAPKSVELKYEKGAGRNVSHTLIPGDCGGNETLGPGVVTTTEDEAGTAHLELDLLTIRHEFNMARLVTSTLFDNATDTINFCQDFGLVHDPNGTSYLITQLLTKVSIKLDMTARFSVDVKLDDVEVDQANETVQLTDFISAFHCEGANMVRIVDGTLRPNNVLNICIESSSEEAEIASLDTMSADGDLSIITADEPVIAAITNLAKSALSRVVSTRLPVNRITFADDATVTIAGSLTLQFKGSAPQAGSRRLAGAAGLAGRQLQAVDEEVAPFAVAIALEPEEEAGEHVQVTGAAAAAASADGVALSAAAMALFLAW